MSVGSGEGSAKVPVVTGVVGSDAHIIGNWLVSHTLEQANFDVHRLGVLTSQEEFIDAAKETDAKAIIVTSLYGMGVIDCQGFREKCDEAGLKDILLYIGGNLAVRGQDFGEIERELKSMGFNRVYPTTADLQEFIADLRGDLGVTLG
ncbi:MAG: methylaspartate mutase subunit S [Chloroflexota bacterium]|nr:MAG: methylaspartate mutase subunit S [Chloroflexota bacterium]